MCRERILSVCKEWHDVVSIRHEGVVALNMVNRNYHSSYEKSLDLLESVKTPDDLLRASDKLLVGLSEEDKFLTQEAFLAAVQDWVRGLTSSNAHKDKIFFRINPRRVILYGTCIILPFGIGRVLFSGSCPWLTRKKFIPTTIQVTRNSKGSYKVKIVKCSKSPIKLGWDISDSYAVYWETLGSLRDILRDHRMGINVTKRLESWLESRRVSNED